MANINGSISREVVRIAAYVLLAVPVIAAVIGVMAMIWGGNPVKGLLVVGGAFLASAVPMLLFVFVEMAQDVSDMRDMMRRREVEVDHAHVQSKDIDGGTVASGGARGAGGGDNARLRAIETDARDYGNRLSGSAGD
jgi:hypothetical protein